MRRGYAILTILSFLILLGGCGDNTSSEKSLYEDIMGSIRVAQQATMNIQTICNESEFEKKEQIENEAIVIDRELKSVEKGTNKQQQTIHQTQKQVDKLQSKQFNFVLFLCFGGIGIGLFLLISGAPKIGMPLIGGSGGVIALIFLLNAIMKFLWLIGLVLAIVIAACLIYFAYIILTKNTAIKELVASVEIVKGSKDKEIIKKELDVLQSKETKQAVNKIKKQ